MLGNNVRILFVTSLIVLIIGVSSACSEQARQNNQNAAKSNATKQTEQAEQHLEKQSKLLISAAASLTVVLDEIAAAFEEQTGITVDINYGSSGALQKQIEQGAPVDIFISAGSKQMVALQEQNVVEQSLPLLRNSLVVISHSKLDREVKSLSQLLNDVNAEHIALGQPETVPAGQYAQEALVAENLWSDWEERYVYGNDVRQVLSYVEQGNAELGFVYATDAASSDTVHVVYTVSAELHNPIEYPIAIVAATKHRNVAQQFLEYVQQAEWIELYEQSGFQVVK